MRTFFESIQKRVHLRFVATTGPEHAQGLMHQEPLKHNEGALFVYEAPSKSKFWNKNVNFPIEIGFFDINKKLVDIRQLQANQTQEIGCKQEFVYALEVSTGFFSQKDIGKSLDDFILS
ncbi:MAG: DUF192 domain-containing protein [Proteobacteria bacterium]|jgi:hypothetical protein|nr:DUF192 domain-containing protein [Pseudomonadota bacterium]